MADSISLGTPPGPDGTTVFEDSSNRVPRDLYTVHRYEEDLGIYSAGITSPNGFQGNKAAIFQLAAPRTLLVVDWSVEYGVDLNDYALIPDWDSGDTNYILADKVAEPISIDIMGDGLSPIYRISGTYVYVVLNGDKVEWRHGRPPWIKNIVPVKVKLDKKTKSILW